MRTRKKGPVEVKDIAKRIVRMARDGMKDLEPEEQERRFKSFCDAVGARPRNRSSGSGVRSASRI